MQIGWMPPSFFDRAMSLPPKMMEFISWSKDPASVKLRKSTSACWRLSSVDPAKRSLICCGVIPSGPPVEPRGNVRNAFITSSLETCKASKRGLSLASYRGRRSSAGPGCFARTASRVSWFTGAGVSPEQMILTTALSCLPPTCWILLQPACRWTSYCLCCLWSCSGLLALCFCPMQLCV